ncbi:hypothetical protein WJX74_008154 [Apatococcus lobatus]|uniref:C3H1-type domain-containing protein n=1 Tax=Apatococcus lobatus TaxID=904363 RepID=A0AAW1SFS1_9CHLO
MVIASPSDQVCMRARLKTPCHACKVNIEEGQEIHPYEGIGWMHLVCAEAYCRDNKCPIHRPVCKHWRKRGYCLYKDKCYYHHPPDALPAPAAPQPVRKPGEKLRDPKKQNRGPGKRNRVNNRFRAGVFRRFLLEEFGDGVLRRGSGVLDVAGGKGEVAFELVNLNGIAATVVDPRPLCLTHFCRWLLGGFCHRNTIFRRYIHRPLSLMQRAEDLRAPHHLRILLEAPIVDALAPPDLRGATRTGMDEDAAPASSGSLKTRRPRRDRHPAARQDHPVRLVEPDHSGLSEPEPAAEQNHPVRLVEPDHSGLNEPEPAAEQNHPVHPPEPNQSGLNEFEPAASPCEPCALGSAGISPQGPANAHQDLLDQDSSPHGQHSSHLSEGLTQALALDAAIAVEHPGRNSAHGDAIQPGLHTSIPASLKDEGRWDESSSLEQTALLEPGQGPTQHPHEPDSVTAHEVPMQPANGHLDQPPAAAGQSSAAEPHAQLQDASPRDARRRRHQQLGASTSASASVPPAAGSAQPQQHGVDQHAPSTSQPFWLQDESSLIGIDRLTNGNKGRQIPDVDHFSDMTLAGKAGGRSQEDGPNPAMSSFVLAEPLVDSQPAEGSQNAHQRASFVSASTAGLQHTTTTNGLASTGVGRASGKLQGHRSAALASSEGLAEQVGLPGQGPAPDHQDGSTPASAWECSQACSAEPPNDWPDLFAASLQKGASLVWGIKGLKGARHEDGTVEEGDSDGDESIVTTLPGEPEDDPITDVQQAWEVLRDASCIVGMHPDQAAGAIVEYALRTGKPFAVVPCCVYSCDFPSRHLPDGRLVKQYEDLIEWLVALDPAHIKVADLLIDVSTSQKRIPPEEPAATGSLAFTNKAAAEKSNHAAPQQRSGSCSNPILGFW